MIRVVSNPKYFFLVLCKMNPQSLSVDPYISTHVARIKETSFTRARAEWLVMEPTSTLDARMSLLKLKRASQVTRGQTIFSLSLSLSIRIPSF